MLTKRFNDKTIVVTGGSKGIGRAICELFHQEGANVAVFDVDTAAGEALQETASKNLRFFKCNVADKNEVKSTFEKVVSAFGEIDFLVNNAGVLAYTNALTTTEEEWDRVLGINLKGAWLCAQQAIGSMQKKGQGCIINMASINSFHCQKMTLPYATSKAGLLGLTRSIAIDFKPNIRSVAICPGTVDTPMLHQALESFEKPDEVMEELNKIHLTGRIGKPEEVAELVAYLCSDAGRFVNGQAMRIDGGLGLELGGVE